MDDSYRPLLPQIQLRGSYPDWLPDAILGLVLFVVVASLVYPLVRNWLWRRQTYRQLAANARERSLNSAQTALLERIARRARLRQPLLLLTSLSAFDRHVGGYAKNLKTPDDDEILAQITRIRVALGFDHVPPDQPLRSTYQLPIGQRLQVFPTRGDRGGFAPCVLVDADQRGLSATALLREDDQRLCDLAPGEQVKVRFWRQDDTEYRFRSKVLETAPETSAILIAHTEKLERIQKRDFFRLDIRFDFLLHFVGDGDPPATEQEKSLAATAVDISGNGLGLLVEREVEVGAILQIPDDFSNTFPLAGLRGQVSECKRQKKGYKLGLEFIDLPARLQNEIVRLIYQQQLKRVVG